MDSDDDDSEHRYSALSNAEMDVDGGGAVVLLRSPSSSAFSDMIWSPIPTQSTLNNWQMLTQSLSQDIMVGLSGTTTTVDLSYATEEVDDDVHDDDDEDDDASDELSVIMEQQSDSCVILQTPIGGGSSPPIILMPSPDMFEESSSSQSPPLHSPVSDDDDDFVDDISMTNVVHLKEEATTLSANEIVSVSFGEGDDKTAEKVMEAVNHNSETMSMDMIINRIALDECPILANDLVRCTIPETQQTIDETPMEHAARISEDDNNKTLVEEVLLTQCDPAEIASQANAVCDTAFEASTIPETQYTILEAPATQQFTTKPAADDNNASYVFKTPPQPIRNIAPQHERPNNTIPETQYTPDCTIPETLSTIDPPVPDDDSTYCTEIEHQLTFSSQREPSQKSLTPAAPLSKKHEALAAAAGPIDALDLDPTFCSLVELELEQTRQHDAEEFDFEDAIMRILHVADTQPEPQNTELDSGTEMSQDGGSSGTFDLRISGNCSRIDAQSRDQHLQRIEQIVLRLLLDLAGAGQVCLDMNRIRHGGTTFSSASQTIVLSQDCGRRRVRSRHRIVLLLHLMDVVYRAISTANPYSTRELYYNDPELTQDVRKISYGLSDISCMLDTQPWQLGVMPQSKGRIAGSLRFVLATAEVIVLENRHRGTHLPPIGSVQSIQSSTAEFVLVVEKETVFNKLLLDNVIGVFRNRCILLTGKGYPDINTRFLLRQLWQHLRLPIYVLCDADPHGIQIMLTYRFGSLSLPMCSAQLAVPQLHWLGLRPSELVRHGCGALTVPLSDADRRLLGRMLQRPYIDEAVRHELQWLLANGRKAELEALDEQRKGYLLGTYLRECLGGDLLKKVGD